MMKLHEDHKKLIIVVFFGFISFLAVGTSSLIQKQRNTSSASASSDCNCTDPDVCYPDGCSRKPKTSNNQYEESRYDSVCNQFVPEGWPIHLLQHYCSEQQPDCCFDIYRYKDDRLCCFQERWTCHPSLCEGSSGKGDCGKYWNLYKGNAYGCVQPDANGQPVPIWGQLPPGLPNVSQPTNTPQPQATATPQPPTAKPPTSTVAPNQPTSTPAPTSPSQPTSTVPPNQPTSTPAPTNSPIPTNQQPTSAANTETSYNPQPTNPPLPTNTPYQFPTIEIKSPKELAREVINPQNIQKLNRSTEKILEAPKEGLVTIKQADQKLERTAHSWIERVWVFIENLMN